MLFCKDFVGTLSWRINNLIARVNQQTAVCCTLDYNQNKSEILIISVRLKIINSGGLMFTALEYSGASVQVVIFNFRQIINNVKRI